MVVVHKIASTQRGAGPALLACRRENERPRPESGSTLADPSYESGGVQHRLSRGGDSSAGTEVPAVHQIKISRTQGHTETHM